VARPDEERQKLSEETSLGLATVSFGLPDTRRKRGFLEKVEIQAHKFCAGVYVWVVMICHLLATLSLILLVTLWTVAKLANGENLTAGLADKSLVAVFEYLYPYKPALAAVMLWSIIGCNVCVLLFGKFEWLLFQFVWLGGLGLATAAAVFGLNAALPLVTEIVGGRDSADALILLFSAILACTMTVKSMAYFLENSGTDDVLEFARSDDDDEPPAQRLPQNDITD
jgi:hypothetical protein